MIIWLLHKIPTIKTCSTDAFQMYFCSCTARLPSGRHNNIHTQKWYTMEQLLWMKAWMTMKINMKMKWRSSLFSLSKQKSKFQGFNRFLVLAKLRYITLLLWLYLAWTDRWIGKAHKFRLLRDKAHQTEMAAVQTSHLHMRWGTELQLTNLDTSGGRGCFAY